MRERERERDRGREREREGWRGEGEECSGGNVGKCININNLTFTPPFDYESHQKR